MRLLLGLSGAPDGVRQGLDRVRTTSIMENLLCKSFLTGCSKIVTGGMSGRRGDKFLRARSADERFLNIFSVADTFNLIAHDSFTPVYKGRTSGEMVLCQHENFFQDFSSKNYERSYGVLR